jgi:hypothetical protein
VANNDERVIEKDGYRIDDVPVSKWRVSLVNHGFGSHNRNKLFFLFVKKVVLLLPIKPVDHAK